MIKWTLYKSKIVKRIDELNKDIDKVGATVAVKNGSQEYIKRHPGLSEINKLSKSLLDIERSYGLEEENSPRSVAGLI